MSGADLPSEQPREWVEKDLRFGGFIAFECKIRADSGIVVRSLLQADHKASPFLSLSCRTIKTSNRINLIPNMLFYLYMCRRCR